MNALSVTPIPTLRDNYVWLIHGARDSRQVAIVDPGDAVPVLEALAANTLSPAAILVTHRHWDHTDGVNAIRHHFDVPVYGPSHEAAAIVSHPLADGENLPLEPLGLEFRVLEIPGHTLGHIAFHGHGALFSGDTLFSAGCGRLFEGTPEQMTASLERLAGLPPTTRLYCGHEYTEANLEFAATVEPSNEAIRQYQATVAECRRQQTPSLPSTIGREREVNPFLRITEPTVMSAVEQWSGKRLNDKVDVFAALRRWKDEF